MRKATPSYSVAMYSGDIQGLGHLRRSITIASRLVEEFPGSRVLVFTGLPAGCFFELPSGVDFVKLPAVRKVENGLYRARTLPMTQQDVTHLRAGIIRQATECLRPDLFLADHQPTGIGGELLPTLRDIKLRPDAPAIVLGLRDVLDAPRVSRRLWHEQGAYQAINDFYDRVLIYGCEQVFDTRFQYHLDRHVEPQVSYCGYILPSARRPRAKPSRRQLGLGEGELAVVTAGGGADGYPMMKLCLEAIRRLRHREGLQVICVTGPFMSLRQRQALREQATDLPVRILWCVDEQRPYLAAADLVVTMAGYNTLMEALYLRKKILTIPRRGPSAEQSLRSRIFSELGLSRNVEIRDASPGRVARLIEQSLDASPPVARLPSVHGAWAVVEQLKRLLSERDAWLSLGAAAVCRQPAVRVS